MAGIGFELKKLFSSRQKSISEQLTTVFYSTFVSVGPWIISMGTLFVLMFIAKNEMVSTQQRDLFIATTVYTFIFSQVILSFFLFPITRYISDKLYSNETRDIGASYVGSLIVLMSITLIVEIIFFAFSPFPLYYCIFATLLTLSVVAVWHIFIYISGVKAYKQVTLAYVFGNLVAIGLGILLLYFPIRFPVLELATNWIIAYTVGFMITYVMLVKPLLKIFPYSYGNIFDFMTYLNKYKVLGFTSLFIVTAVWLPSIIIWIFSPLSIEIYNFFRFNINYDLAYFLAILSTMPSLIYFTVIVETKFYENYKMYYSLIAKKGTLEQIEIAKTKMFKSLFLDLMTLAEFQFFITLILILFARPLLMSLGYSVLLINIFRILALGSFCYIIVSLLTLCLLYFEYKKEALYIWVCYTVLTVFSTFYLLPFGVGYLGLSYFISGFVMLCVIILIIRDRAKKLNYYTFYMQPLFITVPKIKSQKHSKLKETFLHSSLNLRVIQPTRFKVILILALIMLVFTVSLFSSYAKVEKEKMIKMANEHTTQNIKESLYGHESRDYTQIQ